ncbi:hypothetical protein JCM19238_5031 [Vibrio ponticus]|nr:hypothetical protein JCM19238_5031 [Vibrio ponticus]
MHELIKALSLGFAFYYSTAIDETKEIELFVEILRDEMESN